MNYNNNRWELKLNRFLKKIFDLIDEIGFTKWHAIQTYPYLIYFLYL